MNSKTFFRSEAERSGWRFSRDHYDFADSIGLFRMELQESRKIRKRPERQVSKSLTTQATRERGGRGSR